MEKILLTTNDRYETMLSEVNEELKQGWKVKMIVPITEHVAVSSSATSSSQTKRGAFGAYIVLEKEGK